MALGTEINLVFNRSSGPKFNGGSRGKIGPPPVIKLRFLLHYFSVYVGSFVLCMCECDEST